MLKSRKMTREIPRFVVIFELFPLVLSGNLEYHSKDVQEALPTRMLEMLEMITYGISIQIYI